MRPPFFFRPRLSFNGPMESAGGLTERFFDSYRAAFEALDPDAISGYFAYPCHVTSDGDSPSLTVAASRDEWRGQIAQLVALYRDLGVTSAVALSRSEAALSERVIQSSVHWSVRDAVGAELYDFHGLYTLVRDDEDFKIAAVAHDELPRLLGLMARRGEASS